MEIRVKDPKMGRGRKKKKKRLRRT